MAEVHRHFEAEGIELRAFIAIPSDILLFAQVFAIKIKVAKVIEIHAMKSVFVKE